MIRFDSDYIEGAHPLIIEALQKTNMEQTEGYSMDPHSERAKQLIKDACNRQNVDVHILVGGTQANTTVISATLRPYQGVLCADTGHINVHETGAIEATGHKVLPLQNIDGKISATQVRCAINDHYNDGTHEHIVQPAMVYISHPTESGTLYSKQELTDLFNTCKEYNIPLFIDGARLGYGLMSYNTDVTLQDITNLCDVFYIGGTKVGAFFGEAVVISNEAIKRDFRYMIKRHGGMFAKGRILGIQFETLFTDDLYYKISRHAIDLAMKLKKAFIDANFKLFADSYTNQQFIILSKNQIDTLSKTYAFSLWGKVDETHSAVRFCTSWATKEENIDQLIRDIQSL